jgi:pyruvate dehydrogenase E1 component
MEHASLAAGSLTPETGDREQMLRTLDDRLRWLSSWTIHNANHLRDSRDGLKVGGHQASCASMTMIMATLYFSELRPEDRVAVKPHASPVFHAIQYLFGRQSLQQLQDFRAKGGAQSYPSRTKDGDDVDFSTGSVGLGVAITSFASLVQDYLSAHGWLDQSGRGRMIALLGDAELDEGNIYEALIEAYKHDIRNTWWIVDYNRQSLDATTADRMFDRFDDIFRTTGWRVITLKYGKAQRSAFAKPGGPKLREWIDNCSNAEFAALTYQGGAAWRVRLLADLGSDGAVAALIDAYDDASLHALMTGLGGHCASTLLDAYAQAQDDKPTLFIAYTVKGFGLPFQGHKDNHSGLMTETQIAELRDSLRIAVGEEWAPLAGLSANEAGALQAFISNAPFGAGRARRFEAPRIDVPPQLGVSVADGKPQSTQMAFGRIMLEIAKRDDQFAQRVVTTSPDVTVSTNLGGFVNQRGLFRRRDMPDVFRAAKIPSAQKWSGAAGGQHIELGIAESNLFLLLGALGLAGELWGERLLPVGTLYDPFISRGLDALNYACYQDARFLLAATPSGVTLGPEGGAHQSISTPAIGIAQSGLSYFEPAYADELAAIMAWGFRHMQDEHGGSVYLRLSTRQIDQAPRTMDEALAADIVAGGYWMRRPEGSTPLAIAYCGALAPEALEASAHLMERFPGLGVLAVTSPDRLYSGWLQTQKARARGETHRSHVEHLLSPLAADASIVTIIDGHPLSLSWLGGVRRHTVHALGVSSFGQCGDLPDLYHAYGLDAEAIVDAAFEATARRSS